jgi:hypothetical protein
LPLKQPACFTREPERIDSAINRRWRRTLNGVDLSHNRFLLLAPCGRLVVEKRGRNATVQFIHVHGLDASIEPLVIVPQSLNLNPAVRRPPRPVRHLPPMISNCGADHLAGDKRFFCNRLQPTVRWPLRGRQLPDLGLKVDASSALPGELSQAQGGGKRQRPAKRPWFALGACWRPSCAMPRLFLKKLTRSITRAHSPF